MARGEHHRIHAHDRLQRNRLRIAQEAARLMSEHGIRDFHHAKLKAAERLGILDTQALPRNIEIEQALREHQRLFHADSQPQLLRRRREAAVEAMRFLGAVRAAPGRRRPRRHRRRALGGLPASVQRRPRCRRLLSCANTACRSKPRRAACAMSRDEQPRISRSCCLPPTSCPFDLTVLPRDCLRQAPLDRTDERPMRRAIAGRRWKCCWTRTTDEAFEQRLSAALR